MPPKSMQSFVHSRLANSAAEELNKVPKAPLTKTQARESGLYIDLGGYRKSSGSPIPFQGEENRPRTTSPHLMPANSSSKHGSHDNYNAFDTDASLRDDMSSYDGDDTLSFKALDAAQRPSQNAHNKHYGHEMTAHQPPEVMQARRHEFSSYPPTSTDGSPSGYERDDRLPEANGAPNGVAFQMRPPPIHRSSQPSTAVNGLSSPRAPLAQSPRTPQASRLTIVREPAPQQPLIRRLKEIPYVRPNTSRGVEPMQAPAPTNNIMASQFANDSIAGDLSDVESLPPADNLDDLDYPLEVLRTKHFAELKSESVDNPPVRTFPKDDPAASLSTLLMNALQSGDKEQQQALLESLDLDHWEQAGDWFVESLAGIIKRFVEIRKEKRRRALELEKEIEARHDLVNEKQQILEENLAGLRKAGHQVLAVGTPKKTPKKRETMG